MAEVEGLGSQWTKQLGNNIYHSPEAKDAGPNQLLILDDCFMDGTIRATVKYGGGQPDHTKGFLEAGLIGRYVGPGYYITGGAGGAGGRHFISEVLGGQFKAAGSNPITVREGTLLDLELELEGPNVRLWRYDGGDRRLMVETTTILRKGGRCGLRANWTEAVFSQVQATSRDKPCFVVAPISSGGSAARLHSDMVLQRVIRPALARCGYKAERADEMDENPRITEAVKHRIENDEVVVVNLTGANPNVYYEVGLRHATGKPTVHVIGGNEQTPFDLHDVNTVRVSFSSDEEIEGAVGKIYELVEKVAGKRP